MKYILKKDDRLVTIKNIKINVWNYKKEIGSTIIDTYDFAGTSEAMHQLKTNLIDEGYVPINFVAKPVIYNGISYKA